MPPLVLRLGEKLDHAISILLIATPVKHIAGCYSNKHVVATLVGKSLIAALISISLIAALISISLIAALISTSLIVRFQPYSHTHNT
jgi:uncharacterized membrane protein